MEVGCSAGQIAKFFSNFEKGEVDRCWNWNGSLTDRGYGRIWFDGKSRRAHRVSYEIHLGTKLQDELVCHRCDNPKCVNPSHLFLGTSEDNMRDKVAKGRSNSCRGEQLPQSVLTQSDVNQIRDLLKCGLFSQTYIADSYKISRSGICLIKQNKSWRT